MQNNFVETIIGAAVIGVAAIFLTFAYSFTDSGPAGDSYRLFARISNATGIGPGTDVRIAGIKVGSVVKQELDPETYEAVIHFTVNKKFPLTEDTFFKVTSEGLLGSNFVSLAPGGNIEEMLADGDQIDNATGAVDLIALISQAVFGSGSSSSSGAP